MNLYDFMLQHKLPVCPAIDGGHDEMQCDVVKGESTAMKSRAKKKRYMSVQERHPRSPVTIDIKERCRDYKCSCRAFVTSKSKWSPPDKCWNCDHHKSKHVSSH